VVSDPVVATGGLVEGEERLVGVTLSNDGGQSAGAVTTRFAFPSDIEAAVTAVAPPAGGGFATAIPSTNWSCDPVSSTGTSVWDCTLAELPADSTTTLYASVEITYADRDDEEPLDFLVEVTAASAPNPTSKPVSTNVVPRPTHITIGTIAGPGPLVGTLGTPLASTTVEIPVTNTGKQGPTSVTLTGIPQAVDVSAAAPWTCTGGVDVVCTGPSLGRGQSSTLALTLTDSPALVDTAGSSTVTAATANASATFSLNVTSAPAALDVTTATPTTLQHNVARAVVFTVGNTGRTTARGLTATFNFPAGVEAYPSLPVVNDWTCAWQPESDQIEATCTIDALAPGVTTEIQVPVEASSASASGPVVVETQATGLSPVSRTVSTVRIVTSELEFSEEVTADLVEAVSGPIAFAVTNTGSAPARGVTATVRVPTSVSFDAVPQLPGEDSEWACTRETGQKVTCTLVSGQLGPGETAAVVLYATAGAAVARQTVVVEVVDGTDPAAAVLTSSVEVNVSSAGLAPRGRWTGGYGVVEIGAPLLGCDRTTSTCRNAMADLGGSAQNNGFDMVLLPESTSELEIPAGADVTFAGLYWSANKHRNDAWTGSLTQIDLYGPSGVSAAREGQIIADVQDNANRQYYQSFVDVTDLVQAGGSGTWSVEGAAVAAKPYRDGDRTYYAGWSLVVVYTTPDHPDQNVTIYDGGAWVASSSAVTFAFEGDEQRQARIGVVAWEGDRGNTGDQLSLNGAALTPIRWNGSLGSDNDAFTSTAMGSQFANSLGVDAKAFRSAPLADGINRLRASTGGDQYLIGVVTVQTSPSS